MSRFGTKGVRNAEDVSTSHDKVSEKQKASWRCSVVAAVVAFSVWLIAPQLLGHNAWPNFRIRNHNTSVGEQLVCHLGADCKQAWKLNESRELPGQEPTGDYYCQGGLCGGLAFLFDKICMAIGSLLTGITICRLVLNTRHKNDRP